MDQQRKQGERRMLDKRQIATVSKTMHPGPRPDFGFGFSDTATTTSPSLSVSSSTASSTASTSLTHAPSINSTVLDTATATPTPTSSANPIAYSEQSNQSQLLSTNVIIAIACGASLLILLAILAACLVHRRNKLQTRKLQIKAATDSLFTRPSQRINSHNSAYPLVVESKHGLSSEDPWPFSSSCAESVASLDLERGVDCMDSNVLTRQTTVASFQDTSSNEQTSEQRVPKSSLDRLAMHVQGSSVGSPDHHYTQYMDQGVGSGSANATPTPSMEGLPRIQSVKAVISYD
ncbi:hypothetical protein BJ741DRAFT_671311 [Chytriomyces cf. hyalinus JEL632]|nr:hypothetical protein BJ741DRAFT_671311 [Chytriomyces cf. hyalinus JEL632]